MPKHFPRKFVKPVSSESEYESTENDSSRSRSLESEDEEARRPSVSAKSAPHKKNGEPRSDKYSKYSDLSRRRDRESQTRYTDRDQRPHARSGSESRSVSNHSNSSRSPSEDRDERRQSEISKGKKSQPRNRIDEPGPSGRQRSDSHRRSQDRDYSGTSQRRASNVSHERSQERDYPSTSKRKANIVTSVSSRESDYPRKGPPKKGRKKSERTPSSPERRQPQQMSPRGNPSNQNRGARNLSQGLSRPGPSGTARRTSTQPSNRTPAPTRTPSRNPGNAGRPPPANRYRPRVLTEIRRLQRSTNFLIHKLPFSRLVKQIVHDLHGNFRWEARALEAMQEACEAYMVELFGDAYLCTLHAGRITLKPSDMQLARRIRGKFETLM